MLERILENFSKYLFYVGLDEVTSVTFSFTGTVGNTLSLDNICVDYIPHVSIMTVLVSILCRLNN
jgi:hypothetical protein